MRFSKFFLASGVETIAEQLGVIPRSDRSDGCGRLFFIAAQCRIGPQKKSVIDRKTIEECLPGEFAEAFRIVADNIPVGGVVVDIHTDSQRGELNLLYIKADCHSRGIGLTVWNLVEAKYPDIKVWETHTPYFEKRNIHFMEVKKVGFYRAMPVRGTAVNSNP